MVIKKIDVKIVEIFHEETKIINNIGLPFPTAKIYMKMISNYNLNNP